MPIYHLDLGGSILPTRWYQSRNLKLYKVNANNDAYGYFEAPSSGSSTAGYRTSTDITSAVFGSSTISPTLSYSGTDSSNTQNKIHYITGNIANYITVGSTNIFYIMTSDSAISANYSNRGLGKITITVVGYYK